MNRVTALHVLIGLLLLAAAVSAGRSVVLLVQLVADIPNMRRQAATDRAACEAHICQDGRHARMLAPRYESMLCACEVRP